MSVLLVNDFLNGRLGEKKVLWNYMMDFIPNLKGIDIDIMNKYNHYNNNISFEDNVESFIKNYYPDCKIIIQNGSWFNLIKFNAKKIILIQDNLRKMGRFSTIQENNFNNADIVVSNSTEVDNYYNQRRCIQIPLGVDDNVFKILNCNKNDLRNKNLLPVNNYNKFGIFVGSFTETKGWKKMQEIICRRKDIYWILVTKQENDEFSSINSKVFKKINQELLVELFNCADFFILPSFSESQCLSAIEANLCGIPSIMRNTGYFTNLSQNEKYMVGVVTDTFSDEDIDKIYKNKYFSREIVIKYFSIDSMIKKWINLINFVNV